MHAIKLISATITVSPTPSATNTERGHHSQDMAATGLLLLIMFAFIWVLNSGLQQSKSWKGFKKRQETINKHKK